MDCKKYVYFMIGLVVMDSILYIYVLKFFRALCKLYFINV